MLLFGDALNTCAINAQKTTRIFVNEEGKEKLGNIWRKRSRRYITKVIVFYSLFSLPFCTSLSPKTFFPFFLFLEFSSLCLFRLLRAEDHLKFVWMSISPLQMSHLLSKTFEIMCLKKYMDNRGYLKRSGKIREMIQHK